MFPEIENDTCLQPDAPVELPHPLVDAISRPFLLDSPPIVLWLLGALTTNRHAMTVLTTRQEVTLEGHTHGTHSNSTVLLLERR